MKNNLFILLLITTSLLSSCKSTEIKSPDDEAVMGPRFAGYFTVTHLGEKTVASNKPTFNIDNKLRRIQGFAGCNTYNAAYTQGNAKLEIFAPITTKKACVDGMDIEQQFTTLLTKANAFTLDKSILTLYDKERNVLLKATPTDM